MFSGDHPTSYRWKLDMQANLSADAAVLGDQCAKFSYVWAWTKR